MLLPLPRGSRPSRSRTRETGGGNGHRAAPARRFANDLPRREGGVEGILLVGAREFPQVLRQGADIAPVLADEGAELVTLFQCQPDAGDAEVDHLVSAVVPGDAEIDLERLIAAAIGGIDH